MGHKGIAGQMTRNVDAYLQSAPHLPPSRPTPIRNCLRPETKAGFTSDRKRQETGEPVIVDGEEEWEVEEILNSKYIGRGLYYLVKWKGFAEEKYNSWELAKNLANSPELVALFHAKNPKALRKCNAARP